jgi:general secretion pathway protein D
VNNYVYRLKYARAETLAMAIMALYSGNPFALASLAAMSGGGGGFGGGYGGFGGGYGGFGGGYGGFGGGYGGFGGGGYGGFGGGYGGFGGGGYGGFNGAPGYNGQPNVLMGYGAAQQYGMGAVQQGTINIPQGANANPAPVGSGDQTGAYLGLSALGVPPGTRIPHVIPNPFDNTLLVQANPQEWEQISSLLRQLDVAPRQVLIDAKIYELDLSGAFASGVQAFLEKRGTGTMTDRALNVASNAGGVLSVGALVLRSHELMLAVSAAETQKKSRIISSPSIIATDSVPAVMNVGQDVPVLTSSGVAVTGSSFNSISNRSTGTTLSILARVSSSGVVTMVIDQDVSQPIDVSQSGSAGSTINSPSFSSRRFSTQLTVNDGDTIAIGGFIQESTGSSSVGIPILQRIPILGAAFGSKAYSKSRTELVVFLTPRVIYDAAQLQDAAEEIKGNLKRIQKMIKDDR